MEKNKKKFKIFVFSFWVLIVFSIYSIIQLLNFYSYKIEIKDSENVLETAIVNFSFKNRIQLDKDFMVCYNDVCKSPNTDFFNNVYHLDYKPSVFKEDFYNSKLTKIYFVYDKKNTKLIEDNIDNIYLYVGNRAFNWKRDDIEKFKKSYVDIELDNSSNKKEYRVLVIPPDFKTNYKGKFNHAMTMFLSLFYNWNIFIIPYFWLFAAFCIYAFKKDEFNFKINNKIYYVLLGAIFVMAFLLRSNLLMYNPLWYDELYTKHVAIQNFISCFKDPGNPPLFFILEYFISKINSSDLALRLVPLFIGACYAPFIYILFKNINKNLALFASFFAAINTINIYQSKEIRSGALCALLVVVVIYYLFKYLKNQKTKNLFLYTFFSILAINTHYYLAIFAFTNFIWGILNLGFKKDIKNKKNEIIKFLISNTIAFLTFVPYLVISFKEAINANFNSWIGSFDKLKFLYTINEFFINKQMFIFLSLIVLINLIVIYLPKNILDKLNLKINFKKANMYVYLIYTMAALLIIISLISINIKPIFHKRIVLSIYTLIMFIEILSISTVLDFKNLKKFPLIIKGFYCTVLFMICMSITHPMPVNKMCKIDDYMNFIESDSKKYFSEGYEIHGFLVDHKKSLKQFPNVKNLNINWHIVNGNKGEYIEEIKKSDYIKNNKKAVLYINTIGFDFEKALIYNPSAYIIHTNSISNAKIIYDK